MNLFSYKSNKPGLFSCIYDLYIIWHCVLGAGRSESSKDPNSSGGGGSGGSGRGPKDVEQRTIKFEYKIPNFDPQNWNYWLPLGLAVTAGYMLTRPSMNSRRISWQEFRVNYLEKGEVDRLEVVNKSLVKVYLRRDAGTGGPGVSDNICCVYTGAWLEQ